MNISTIDIDPLSTYNFNGYNLYHHTNPGNEYQIGVKQENYENFTYKYDTLPLQSQNGPQEHVENEPQASKPDEASQEVTKPQTDEATDFKPKVKKERKGRTSSYWSVKITDENFAFYGCAVCNINFKSLHELDQHVTIHKGRITSYDLRIKNQIKRNNVKRISKKNRKLKKAVKQEKSTPKLELDIKPEDGYIGSEKASEYERDGERNDDEVKSDENKPAANDQNAKKETFNLEKIYKCFACQKQFSLSYYLKLHVRSHTDEKPYTCSVCGQSFITASHLGRHNKRMHLTIKNQCRICFKFFSRFELLTRHFDKKHADDKLEGEPYDYNAILPYLNELEEQLKQKSEADDKPKVEDIWGDSWQPEIVTCPTDLKTSAPAVKDEVLPPENIMLEPVTVAMETHVKIEVEDVPQQEADGLGADDLGADDMGADDPGADDFGAVGDDNDNLSDEDYFPINTWASTPKVDPASPEPRRQGTKPDQTVECDICHKAISSATYLRVHKRTHTGEKPFKCYVCNRGFITSSKMNRHVLTHSNWDEKDVGKLEVGVKDENGAEEDNEINASDETESKSKRNTRFTKKHKKGGKVEKQKKRYQKRPYACEYCHKRFLHPETLQVHKRSHGGEALTIRCSYCLAEVASEAALRAHEASHAGPKPYLCTLCGKGYKKRETMIYHRKHHDQAKEFACEVCQKRFPAQCKLQRHLLSHRGARFVVRYECPVCAHMFHTKYHVQMHLATHQREGLIQEENRNEILAMVLQNARKIPKQPEAGSAVTDAMPPDERSRVCNICGEVFQHFYYLEEHLKSHGSKIAIEDIEKAEVKKYVCPVCNKSFKLHYYLKLHSFTHSKEKPFICQQCGKGFITRGKLKRHLETHSGLKKYQCHVCYKFFTRPSYLRIHVRTIHGTQDYNFRLNKSYEPSFGQIANV